MHEYHEALPGYDERQIFFDGCEECEDRGRCPEFGMTYLDPTNLHRAWQRAYKWNRLEWVPEDTGPLSEAEIPLLRLLWRFQVLLERNGGFPINGNFPKCLESR